MEGKKRTLQGAIRRAKALAWEELLETLDKDPWGRPFCIVRKKLGSGAPPVTECLQTRTLDNIIEHLFLLQGPEGVVVGRPAHVPQQPWTEDLRI